MSAATLKIVEQQAKQLAHDEQLLLTQHLLAHLQQDSLSKVEAIWLDEADTRYQAYQQGKITATPAAEVHKQLRQQRTP